jgi:hypothetical protein
MDENKCTVHERCDLDKNQCVLEQKLCDDCNACTADMCVPETGECMHRSNSTNCDDNNRCTNDFCDPLDGCYYEPVQCQLDAGPCQEAVCSTVSGCTLVAKDCDDDNYCTEDSCGADGECVHVEIDCDDGNPYTEDSCDPAKRRCVHRPLPCDESAEDDDKCTVYSFDPVAGCQKRPKICHNADACTVGQCVKDVGCVYEEISCDDGNPCTRDFCEPGKHGGCQHTQIRHCCQLDDDCYDGNECTVDTCVAGMCHFQHPEKDGCGKHLHKDQKNKFAKEAAEFIHAGQNLPKPAKPAERAQVQADCGNGLVEDPEECDGPDTDGFFRQCQDDCTFRTSAVAVMLVVLASLCGICALVTCCVLVMGQRGRRRRRR